jgi:hypothetical protein
MQCKSVDLLVGFCACFILTSTAAMSQSLDALKTPPSVLNALTPSGLNTFGIKAINEAYTIFSQVGSKTGDIGGRLNQENANAVKNAKSLFDDKALIQTARLKYGLTKKTFTPTDIDEFKASDVVVTIPASGIIVASYKIALPNRVDLKAKTILSGDNVPRLTVLRWDNKKKQWLVFSHADFDTPSAILCGEPSKFKPHTSHYSEDNIRLARKILETQFANVVKGNSTIGQAKGFQVVYASGEQRDSTQQPSYTFSQKPKITEIEATRNGNLLAIRYNGPGAASFEGSAVDPSVKPRLLTFYKNEKGDWERVSAAIFSVTSKVANDIKCVMPTVK